MKKQLSNEFEAVRWLQLKGKIREANEADRNELLQLKEQISTVLKPKKAKPKEELV